MKFAFEMIGFVIKVIEFVLKMIKFALKMTLITAEWQAGQFDV